MLFSSLNILGFNYSNCRTFQKMLHTNLKLENAKNSIFISKTPIKKLKNTKQKQNKTHPNQLEKR